MIGTISLSFFPPSLCPIHFTYTNLSSPIVPTSFWILPLGHCFAPWGCIHLLGLRFYVDCDPSSSRIDLPFWFDLYSEFRDLLKTQNSTRNPRFTPSSRSAFRLDLNTRCARFHLFAAPLYLCHLELTIHSNSLQESH